MLIWFLVLAPVLVAEVFRSPMMDLRFVLLGASLPILEVFSPAPPFLHTFVAPMLTLLVVMLATIDRRLLRRRLLGIPIGLFMHIVLDGTWRFDELMLWPAFGFSLEGVEPPEQHLPFLFGLLLEGVGLVIAYLAYNRYGLNEAANRERLLRRGQLNRTVFG